ncbi:Flp pilus assembly complex ATPase component TadA [Candidatus Woesearchaeota archaeon]|nr:Flp pilus assembly complex ATPase component TadA [Candidatus Woesearchaeota archaeon]
MENLYVTDTSVIIEKAISKLIKNHEIEGKIIVPKAVIAELEHQANKGQEIGYLGLEEIQELQKLKRENKIELEFSGQRPNPLQIKYAKTSGEIDSLIREIAYNEGAVLITADKVQSEAAKALGLEIRFIELKIDYKKIGLEKFFDNETMSVHLKEDCLPKAKKGKPGDWILANIGDKKLAQKEIIDLAKEAVEKSNMDPKSFVEISRRGSTIIQYRNIRIVITKPPVSDGWEITAVRPIKQLNLEEYNLPKEIYERIKTKARGIIIAGETGSGKSTISQAIAESYAKEGKITKTVESPRDLILSDEITQYSKNFTSQEEIHDILFLSRPDNIIFDEIRDTPDFKLYIDLRLAGSNCLGVLHSASPIDAVQRFISRIDTGMIPSVLDTIMFIEKGTVKKVLTLAMIVKVPTGMQEADLARPIVEVRDFLTNKLEYEIYSYGEQTVVVPISLVKDSAVKKLAKKQIENEFRKYSDNFKVEFTSEDRVNIHLPENEIARIIGKQGKTIEAIEDKLGIHIDIKELEEIKTKEDILEFEVKDTGKYIVFYINNENKEVDININDQFLISAKSSKRGEIKIHKKSKLGQSLTNALNSKKKIELKG